MRAQTPHPIHPGSLLLIGLAACGPDKSITVLGPFGSPPGSSPDSAEDTGSLDVPELEPIACGAPSDTFSYTESGETMGLLDTTDGNPVRMFGNPLAIADFDDDGDDDIVIALRAGGIWLQRNTGGHLDSEQLTDSSGVLTLALGDLDRDGDLDLVAAGELPPVVLFNDGTGGFYILGDNGLESATATHRDVSLGDVDGDGDLDLFATADPFGATEGTVFHSLWENDGIGHFTDISTGLTEDARSGLGWHTLLTDLDGDLDVDLFISNADQAEWGPNRLVLNDGVTADGIAWRDATDDCGCGFTLSAMGASAADVNRDGLPELYVTQSGPSVLLQNLSNGEFADATAAYGAQTLDDIRKMTFGSLLFDFDNDGWLDIATAAGPMRGAEPHSTQPEAQANVLLAGFDGGFEDVSAALGFDDTAPGRAVTAGYLNDDAFLDVVVSHLDAPSRIYLSSCTNARALVVELRGQTSPPFGEGARVELHAGETVLSSQVSANPGWAAAMHPRAHFGLGELEPDRLVVHWPSGQVQAVAIALDGSARVQLSEPSL